MGVTGFGRMTQSMDLEMVALSILARSPASVTILIHFLRERKR